MSLFDVFILSLRSGVSPLNVVIALVVAVVAALLVVFMRFSMNKKWGGGLLCMTLLALLVLVLTISFLGLKGAASYLEKQRYALEAELREDPVWRNEALGRAWQKLNVADGQSGLVPAEEGGTDLRVSSSAEAQIYTEILAEVLEEELLGRLDHPNLADFKPAQEVAAYVFDSNEMLTMEYPSVLNQDNVMANLVMEHRSGEYYTPYGKQVSGSRGKMTLSLFALAGISSVLALGIVSVGAWKDLMKFEG